MSLYRSGEVGPLNRPFSDPMSKHAPHPPETVAAAEMLYVVERRSQADVQEKVGISASTFRRWKDKYRWDERRRDAIVSIPNLVADMKADIARTYAQAKKEERPLTAAERDGVNKTVGQMLKLDKGALFHTHGILVMDLFSAYLKEHAPQLHAAARRAHRRLHAQALRHAHRLTRA